MTVINTAAASQISSLVKGAHPAAQQPQKNSELWLNLGVEVQNGDKPAFISLPFGLPIDNMKPARAATSNAEWNAIAQAKNGLLEELQKLGASLEPGADLELNLVVKLHRSANNAEPEAADNTLLAQVLKTLR